MWNRHLIFTRVSPDQCCRRIRNKPCHWLDLVPERPLKGGVSPTGFSVTLIPWWPCRGRALGSGVVAYGRIAPVPDGTRIVVRFGLPWFICLVLVLLGGWGLLEVVSGVPLHRLTLPQILFPLFPFLAFSALQLFLFLSAQWQRDYLLQLLKTILAAEEHSAGN